MYPDSHYIIFVNYFTEPLVVNISFADFFERGINPRGEKIAGGSMGTDSQMLAAILKLLAI